MPGRPCFEAVRVHSPGGRLRGRDYLALAATPTFAVMALLTVFNGQDHEAMSDTRTGLLAPFSGMTAMYLLMAFFHLGSWFKPSR